MREDVCAIPGMDIFPAIACSDRLQHNWAQKGTISTDAALSLNKRRQAACKAEPVVCSTGEHIHNPPVHQLVAGILDQYRSSPQPQRFQPREMVA